MIERLYFEHPYVYVLAECDPGQGGQALYVVCEEPGGAEYAALLAARLGVPVRPRPEPGHEAAPAGSAAI